MEADHIPLKVNGSEIEGNHPVVIIGPNGAGKTRLGVQISKNNSGERISALRNLQIGNEIPQSSTEKAEQQVGQMLSSAQTNYWNLSGELQWLLTKIKAEDVDEAVHYRDSSLEGELQRPKETKLTRLITFWNKHFPGRSIDFSSYRPMAKSELGSENQPYQIQRMSDGERVSIYLAARIIDADSGILVIDEPEVHLHPVLARRLWNEFEQMRPDCRFVYITHDLPFALSRRDTQFINVKSDGHPEILPKETEIPDNVIESILGAASFSVTAERIVFCEEGKRGGRDESFYSSWFKDKSTAVISVGSSEEVIKCTEVFNTGKAIKGGNAIGIIDRDYWPEEYFEKKDDNIIILNFHELENLFCLPDVFRAVANHIQIPENEIQSRYDSFIEKARAIFQGPMRNKQILERARKRVEVHATRLVNQVKNDENLSKVESNFVSNLSPENWDFSAEKIFEEEKNRINKAISGSKIEFLKLLPGKSFFSHAASELGLNIERYVELICAGLRNEKNELDEFEQAIQNAFKDHLPSRDYNKKVAVSYKESASKKDKS